MPTNPDNPPNQLPIFRRDGSRQLQTSRTPRCARHASDSPRVSDTIWTLAPWTPGLSLLVPDIYAQFGHSFGVSLAYICPRTRLDFTTTSIGRATINRALTSISEALDTCQTFRKKMDEQWA